jgi:hypothetical protein
MNTQLRITEQQLDLFVAYLPGQEPELVEATDHIDCQRDRCGHVIVSRDVDPRPDCAYPVERWTCSCGTASGFWAAPSTAAQRWALHLAGKT